jgi:hypothetical protein
MACFCIKGRIGAPPDSPQLAVRCMHRADEGPLPRKASPVHAAQGLEHPAGWGVWSRLALRTWEGGLGGCEARPETVFQGRLDQHAHGHDQQEGPESLGFRALARGRQHAWGGETPQAAFPRRLALIPCQPLQGW